MILTFCYLSLDHQRGKSIIIVVYTYLKLWYYWLHMIYAGIGQQVYEIISEIEFKENDLIFMMKKWGYLIWITFGMVASTLAQTDAEQFLKQRMNNPLLRTEGNLTGEGVCWHAAYDMDRFMDRYRATSDPAWLDAAAK